MAKDSPTLIGGRAVAGCGVAGIFSGALVTISLCSKSSLSYSMYLYIIFSDVARLFSSATTTPRGIRSLWRGLGSGVSCWATFGRRFHRSYHLEMVFLYQVSVSFANDMGLLSYADSIITSSLPIGGLAAAVVVLILHLPETKDDSGKNFWQKILELDLIGASLLIPAIVCLLLALQWGGNQYPWSDSKIIGLFIGFGLIAILFGISQYYLGERATLPPRILKNRTVWASSAFVVGFGGAFFLFMYYLPIYFQSVKNHSATKSGIDLLPILLATVFSSIFFGGLISAVGYYTPFLIFSTVLFCIGSGLITTYSTTMPTGRWIGYQILAGAGVGAGFQVPMTAVQTVLVQDDIPIGTATVMFFQNLGGALFISVGQSVFQNGLVSYMRSNVQDIEPSVITNAGATAVRQVLSEMGKLDELPAVVEAYMTGLIDSYRVSLALTCFAFVATLFIEWKTVKKGAEPAMAV